MRGMSLDLETRILACYFETCFLIDNTIAFYRIQFHSQNPQYKYYRFP